jgi:phosphoadenosine phosphosulfate reductase
VTLLAPPNTEELADLNASFEVLDPEEAALAAVAWAVGRFGRALSVTSAMADTVIVHLATSVDPGIDVVFLDTGFHFPETLETLERARDRYSLNLRVGTPATNAPNKLQIGVEGCCGARKVSVLDSLMSDRAAWITGLRRADSPDRATTPMLAADHSGRVKVCPIARWTDADVDRYIATNNLIVNPLLSLGYPSIGCWPCTSRVEPGADPRSGRWADSEKTECGIHGRTAAMAVDMSAGGTSEVTGR